MPPPSSASDHQLSSPAPASTSFQDAPPPSTPVRVILGIPGGPSPPKTLSGKPLSPIVYFFAYNIPPHLSADDLKRLMSSSPGCMVDTLVLRTSKRAPGTVEFVVEFANRSLAEQCVAKLAGRPFLGSHAHLGSAVYKIMTQSDQDGGYSDPVLPVIPSRPNPPRPALPRGPTRETFDIGERPSADVSFSAVSVLCFTFSSTLNVGLSVIQCFNLTLAASGSSQSQAAHRTATNHRRPQRGSGCRRHGFHSGLFDGFISCEHRARPSHVAAQDIAHEFITSAVFNGCLLVRQSHAVHSKLIAPCIADPSPQARHRNSTEIDAKDVIPHIERHWGVSCEAHKVDLSKK
jgi:hypothetical protein